MNLRREQALFLLLAQRLGRLLVAIPGQKEAQVILSQRGPRSAALRSHFLASASILLTPSLPVA